MIAMLACVIAWFFGLRVEIHVDEVLGTIIMVAAFVAFVLVIVGHERWFERYRRRSGRNQPPWEG